MADKTRQEEGFTEAERSRLFDLLPEDDWRLIWGCFNDIQFKADAVDQAYRIRVFLRTLLKIRK